MRSRTFIPKVPQRGFGIVLALFLLVVVALLAATLLRLTGDAGVAGLWAEQGARAYFAARGGAAWGVRRLLQNPPGCAGGTLALAGHTVAVSCAPVAGPYDEGTPQRYTVYRITAVASRGGFAFPDAVERRVTVLVRR
ncbi:MAG: hypothetical protein KatS3mg121_1048 [Gammaproteobacteria bacterium]|nr:MAG: hypothetical protein KatS3mg121_1048 [Gammaproteobacteria bacterium]